MQNADEESAEAPHEEQTTGGVGCTETRTARSMGLPHVVQNFTESAISAPHDKQTAIPIVH
jgi:hypothetical protein